MDKKSPEIIALFAGTRLEDNFSDVREEILEVAEHIHGGIDTSPAFVDLVVRLTGIATAALWYYDED